MAAREFVMLVKEASYGVPVNAPVIGTDAYILRLDGSNGFNMQLAPVFQPIMHGGGRATLALNPADHFNCVGSLQTKLYEGSYSKFLLDWAMTPISGDRSAPWTTTDANFVMPVGDLASISIYHGIQRNNSTYFRRRVSGCKVHSGSVASSRQSPIATISLQIQGIRDDTNAAGSVAYPDATEFPAPDESDYPVNPYLFSHTGTNLKIGTTITQYDSVQFDWTNTMDPRHFESRYIIQDKFCGRSCTLQVALHYKASPDWYAAYLALTQQDVELAFDNGTYSLKIDMHAANMITALPWELPIDQTYMQIMTLQNMWDGNEGTDITISATEPPPPGE